MRIVKTLAFGCLSLLSLGIGVNSAGAASNALQPGVARFDDAASLQSVAKAYRFLHRMLNKYAKGSTTRLVQSFDGGPLKGFTDAVTYDDALFVDALLARSTPGDLASAQVVGNAFLFVQAHDQAGDGRLRAAYAPKPLQSPGDVIVRDNTSDVGNMA